MKNLYILQLTETYKPGEKITYYQHELGSLLMDTKCALEATLFGHIDFCNDLKDEIEENYDYSVNILHYQLK